jgi:hypothetical protein
METWIVDLENETMKEKPDANDVDIMTIKEMIEDLEM